MGRRGEQTSATETYHRQGLEGGVYGGRGECCFLKLFEKHFLNFFKNLF